MSKQTKVKVNVKDNKSSPRGGRPGKGRGGKQPAKGRPAVERKALPVAYASTLRGSEPRINGGKSFTVSHREFLEDIKMTSDYTTIEYSINPGLTDSFPWLGGVASLFEQYRFTKLRWIFEPSCATTSPGIVYMATDYDSSDAVFSNKEVMASYPNHTRSNAYMPCVHDSRLNMGDYLKKYFTRYASVPSGDDERLYDVGNFAIATMSGTPNLMVGELYVEYTVELFTPRIGNLPGLQYSYAGHSVDATIDSKTQNIYEAKYATDLLWGHAPKFTGDEFIFPTSPNVYQIAAAVYNVVGTSISGSSIVYTDAAEVLGTGYGTNSALSIMYSAWVLATNPLSAMLLNALFVAATGTYNSKTKCAVIPSGVTSGMALDVSRSRFTPSGYKNLLRLCKKFNITVPALFERDGYYVPRAKLEEKAASKPPVEVDDGVMVEAPPCSVRPRR